MRVGCFSNLPPTTTFYLAFPRRNDTKNQGCKSSGGMRKNERVAARCYSPRAKSNYLLLWMPVTGDGHVCFYPLGKDRGTARLGGYRILGAHLIRLRLQLNLTLLIRGGRPFDLWYCKPSASGSETIVFNMSLHIPGRKLENW